MATNSQTELVLSSHNLPQVLNDLSSISAGSVINFGLNLNVSHNIIAVFERKYNGDMRDILREILNERLKQEPPLTWHDVVAALRSPSVDEDRLATQIESQYLTHSHPLSSVTQQGADLSSAPRHQRCELSSIPRQERTEVSQQERMTTNTATALSSHHSVSADLALPASPRTLCNSLYQQPQNYLHHSPRCFPQYQSRYSYSMPSHVHPRLRQPQQSSYHPTESISELSNHDSYHRLPPYSVVQPLSDITRQPLYTRQCMHPFPPNTRQSSPLNQPPLVADSNNSQSVLPVSASPPTKRIRLNSEASIPHCSRIGSAPNPLSSGHNLGCGLPSCVQTLAACAMEPSSYPQSIYASSMTDTYTTSIGSARDCAPHTSNVPSLQAQHPIHVYSRDSTVGLPERLHMASSEQSHLHLHASFHGSNPASPIQQFSYYVKIFYKGYKVERDPKVLKLHTPAKIFINLMCIDRHSVKNARDYDEVTEAMICDGNVDVVHKKKWPIDIDKIAANLPDTSLEKVILVEGAPGVGKSTFAREFCRRWERGEIAQQYHLVLLLRLREERLSNAKSLKDLIYHPREAVRNAVTTELESTLGVNTLFILEGFDELPEACRSAPSVYLQLISGHLLQ